MTDQNTLLACAAILCSGLIAMGFAMLAAAHVRSTATYSAICFLAGLWGSGLAGGCIAWSQARDAAQRTTAMATEIDADEYHVVSLWRRSDCQLDALAGRALADGRIDRGEYDGMDGMAKRLRREAARADAGGSSPERTCSVITKG